MTSKNNKGVLVIVSGPSGAGKSTIISRVSQLRSDIRFSVSATTRAPREGEKDGVNYFATIVFHDEDRKKRFMQAISVNTWEQYVTLEQVLRVLNLDETQLAKLREAGIEVGDGE